MDREEGALSRSGDRRSLCSAWFRHAAQMGGVRVVSRGARGGRHRPARGRRKLYHLRVRTNVKFPGMRDANGRDMETTNANGTEPTPGMEPFHPRRDSRQGGVAYDDVAATGADVQMNIYFDCDLDRGIEACAPKVPFEVIRVDTANSSLSRGYNVRGQRRGSADALRGDDPRPRRGDSRARESCGAENTSADHRTRS